MPEKSVRIAGIDELRPGRMKRIHHGDRQLLLANVDGDYLLTDDTCPHEEASLSNGALHGDCVSCPLHGSRFNLRTGQPLEEPADSPLQVYRVHVEGESIMAEIGDAPGG